MLVRFIQYLTGQESPASKSSVELQSKNKRLILGPQKQLVIFSINLCSESCEKMIQYTVYDMLIMFVIAQIRKLRNLRASGIILSP